MSLDNLVLEWDLPEVARVLRINEDEAREYFTDGRRLGPLLERRLAAVLGGRLAPCEGARFDLIAPGGGYWEVRSLTRGGAYFCPSAMIGSGRAFHEAGFLAKLDALAGYLVGDITGFPRVPVWAVTREVVLGWWQSGLLGRTSHVSRNALLRLIGASLRPDKGPTLS